MTAILLSPSSSSPLFVKRETCFTIEICTLLHSVVMWEIKCSNLFVIGLWLFLHFLRCGLLGPPYNMLRNHLLTFFLKWLMVVIWAWWSRSDLVEIFSTLKRALSPWLPHASRSFLCYFQLIPIFNLALNVNWVTLIWLCMKRLSRVNIGGILLFHDIFLD